MRLIVRAQFDAVERLAARLVADVLVDGLRAQFVDRHRVVGRLAARLDGEWDLRERTSNNFYVYFIRVSSKTKSLNSSPRQNMVLQTLASTENINI